MADRLTAAAVEALRAAILDAGGNELYLLGTLDDDGRVNGLRVLARGNRRSVPALLQIPRPGEVVLHNHPGGRLAPSDADVHIAGALGQNGVGSYIVDNAVTAIHVVVEPHRPPTAVQIDRTDAIAWLAPGSAIAAHLDGYEHRTQQQRMLAGVAAAFNDDGTLTVEAGTGTGKSLAYLLPAVAWSLRNKERVLVSTHTINLQEQLVRKDLPFLGGLPGFACRTALVKGRGNYLCRRKASQIKAQPALLVEDEVQRELREVLAWAERTADGSLADLPVRPRPEVWEQVVSENDNCLRARCPFYGTCFFYTARRNAAQADIVVVNHHLLLADLALRDEVGSYSQNAILPPARRVIVDEAHHVEDVATSYFGLRAGYATIERPFSRLQSRRDPQKGVLRALVRALTTIDAAPPPAATAAARLIEARLVPRTESLLTDAEQCFSELFAGLEDLVGRAIEAGREEKLRVTDTVRTSAYWGDVERWLTRLGGALGDFAETFEAVFERLDQLDTDALPQQIVFLTTELRALQGRVAGAGLALLEFLRDDGGACRWFEARVRPRTGAALTLHAAPIDVGPLLRRALFEPFPTVVLTSATLTVDGRFDYLHDRLGLAGLEARERVQTLRVESPFDFDEQALLAVPSDLPDANEPGYEPATHTAIREVLQASRGGTFVLFTAYGALRRAVAALGPELTAAGLVVLQQGETNRHLLLERFVRTPGAVLFATDSFWEGVDVRGDALRCVVITRLPFRVPTEPIEQARVEAIAARGGNPFAEHALPQAVLKLKQGFGRLIRSRTDRGVVVLLDSRVTRKPYGRVFLESLPPARRIVGRRSVVTAAVRRFFAGVRSGSPDP